MTGIGLPDLVVILVIALLFLGPKRLPEAGRAVGHGIREFKESLTGENKPEIHELDAADAASTEKVTTTTTTKTPVEAMVVAPVATPVAEPVGAVRVEQEQSV